jgi:hypothetical protein
MHTGSVRTLDNVSTSPETIKLTYIARQIKLDTGALMCCNFCTSDRPFLLKAISQSSYLTAWCPTSGCSVPNCIQVGLHNDQRSALVGVLADLPAPDLHRCVPAAVQRCREQPEREVQ